MLLLALLPSPQQPATRRPCCACQSKFLELWSLQLLALLVHTLELASWCRGPDCTILNQLLELELMLLLALLTFSSLLLGALVRLPKLVPGAGAMAAACPSRAHPLAGVFMQWALLCHPR